MANFRMTNSERVLVYAARKNTEVSIQRFCKSLEEGKQFLGDIQKELGLEQTLDFYSKEIKLDNGVFDVLSFSPDQGWTTYITYFPYHANNKQLL